MAESKPERKPEDVDAPTLLASNLPPTQWIIGDLLPEGLTILVGKRKVGKSWLALNLALAVSQDDALFETVDRVADGDVLYVSYEDPAVRMQRRFAGLSDAPDERLVFAFDYPRAPSLFTRLEEWVENKPNPRLVILDVLQTAWPRGERITAYERSYEILSEFWQFAHDHHVAVVGLHHPTKGKNDDPLDAIRGAGIAEVADTLWVLKQDPTEPQFDLYVVGRDIEHERVLTLVREDFGKWRTIEATNPNHGIIRAQVMAAGKPITPKELHERMVQNGYALEYELVKKLLLRLSKKGKLKNDGKGRYSIL